MTLAFLVFYPPDTLAQPIPPDEPLPLKFRDPAVFCTVPGACNPSSTAHPLGLVVADIIGNDDYPDVVVVNRDHHSVSVFRNTGAWNDPANALVHVTGSPYALDGKSPYDVDIGDLDGDLDLDLVITIEREGSFENYTPGELIVLYNDSSLQQFGNLEHVALSPPASNPRGLEIADFDQDGRVDIAVATAFPSAPGTPGPDFARVEVLYGQSGGGWSPDMYDFSYVGPTLITQCTEIVHARMTEQAPSGYKDLVVGTQVTGENPIPRLLILRPNPSTGSFIPLVQSSGTNTYGIAVGKLGTNSCRSVAATRDASTDRFDTYDGTCTGFVNPSDSYLLSPAEDPYGVAIGKLNTDSYRDIVIAVQHGAPCGGHGGVVVYLGNSDGTFAQPPAMFCVDPDDPPKPCFVKIADMNQDMLNDVITANTDAGKLSVLINDSFNIP